MTIFIFEEHKRTRSIVSSLRRLRVRVWLTSARHCIFNCDVRTTRRRYARRRRANAAAVATVGAVAVAQKYFYRKIILFTRGRRLDKSPRGEIRQRCSRFDAQCRTRVAFHIIISSANLIYSLFLLSLSFSLFPSLARSSIFFFALFLLIM